MGVYLGPLRTDIQIWTTAFGLLYDHLGGGIALIALLHDHDARIYELGLRMSEHIK